MRKRGLFLTRNKRAQRRWTANTKTLPPFTWPCCVCGKASTHFASDYGTWCDDHGPKRPTPHAGGTDA